MWSVLYRDISIHPWVDIFHSTHHYCLLECQEEGRNAKKIHDKISYLDILHIRMRLLIGRITNIGETEFHISLFLISIRCVPRLISKLYTVRYIIYEVIIGDFME